MSQFNLVGLDYRDCQDVSDENVDLKLVRNVGFYMIQLYIPSALVVVLSWVSFCLDVGSVPGRVSLGILTVLTITNMKTIAVSSLPKVSYIKAIDVWMAACLTFVFCSLLEFAVVNAYSRRLIPAESTWTVSLEYEPLQTKMARRQNSQGAQRKMYIPDPNGITRANMIDKVSMVAFPVGFVTFVSVYVHVYARS